MDKLLQPSASLQPGSLLSLHVSGRSTALCSRKMAICNLNVRVKRAIVTENVCAGVSNFDGIMDSQQGHQVTVTGLAKLRNTPLASVLSQGVSAGSLDHSPLGISSRCSNACLEQLLQVNGEQDSQILHLCTRFSMCTSVALA